MGTPLDALPAPGARRPAVRVTKDAERQLRAGHPWLYDTSIRSVSHDAAPGDLAVVFDDQRRFLAIGLWDPTSPIRVRVLHHGRPTTIDGTFWRERLADALLRRSALLATAGTPVETTGFRWVHGENDGLPGLVVDRYDDVAVVKLYTAAWIPHLPAVVAAVEDLAAPRSVVLRLARALQQQDTHGLSDGLLLTGEPVADAVRFREHGLRFEADVVHGQKTGHFLDQRENRVLVASWCQGARLLDVFSCNGGFSVHAAAAGAVLTHRVDASPAAIEAGQRNTALNLDRPAVAACRHLTTVGDAFAVMERLGATRERYDVVVVDPPSFAANAASVPRALSAYARLSRLALPLVAPGGLLVQASCSSRVTVEQLADVVHDAARRTGRPVDEIARTGHPIDHPIGFPQGAYLKAIVLRMSAHPADRAQR